jgi:hypothetical protein
MGEVGAYSEVDDLEAFFVFGEEHDVFGFEIAVHDVMGVAVVDGRKQLLHVEPCLCLGQRLFVDDAVEEFSALAVVHHDVEVLLLVENVVNAHDAGVVLHNPALTSLFRISDSYSAWIDFFRFSMRFAARTTLDKLCVTR